MKKPTKPKTNKKNPNPPQKTKTTFQFLVQISMEKMIFFSPECKEI